MIAEINYQTTIVNENLEFVNNSINETMQAKTIESNYKIQKRIFWLTIAIILLTILAILPEDARQSIFKLISNKIPRNKKYIFCVLEG